MAELCLAYLDHAKVYYPHGNEYSSLKMAIRPVSELYSILPAAKFGPLEFGAVRQWWLDRDISRSTAKDRVPRRCCRKTINEQMNRLLRILKWGVAQGMVPVSVYQTLKCVSPLKRGRCTAPESKPIRPVAADLVAATLPHLTQVLADMVRFQQLVGCRPGELVKITPAMVVRDRDVWTIELLEHKTAYLKVIKKNQE